MPLSTDLTDALIALIPEDGSRISNAEIKAALEQGVGEPLSDTQLEEAKKTWWWRWERQRRREGPAVA